MTQGSMIQQQVQRKYTRAPIGEAPGRGAVVYSLPRYASPIGANTNPLIQQIKQLPAVVERSRKVAPSTHLPALRPARGELVARGDFAARPLLSPRAATSTLPQNRTATQLAQPRRLRRHGLSLGLIAPILAIGGLTAFSVISLNWAGVSGQQAALLPWGASGMTLKPGKDTVISKNMASYAGITAAVGGQADALIPLNMMETFTWEEYTVQRGDTISEIAQDHALSMDAIIASNNISNAKVLRIGEKLKIPNMDGIPYTVKQGDTLDKIVALTGVPLTAILDANDLQDERLLASAVLFLPGGKMGKEELNKALGVGAAGDTFAWPIRGRLTSPYGWRDDPFTGVRAYHAALDMAAALGTPVKATMSGKVSSVGVNSVYGKFIIITHNNGFQTMYGHLSSTSVTQGETVKQGAKIGEVGSTGRSTGPHLHLALYKNGRAVNPLDYLK
jgi:murein DD-endopeptidase MepM/ murein hydrolase activator NlpD